MTDVLVIGAGHNGLAAGAYLARAGLDTLVLEAGPGIGGMTNTCTPIAAAPHHRMNLCAVDVVFMRGNSVRRDLELDRFGYREVDVDPGYVYLHPDDASLALWRDPRRTAEEIRRFSPPDAEAFLELARDLDAIIDLGGAYLDADAVRPGVRAVAGMAGAALRRARRLPSVSALALGSAAEVLHGRFRSEIVRNAIAQLATTAAGPLDADMSGLGLMFLGFVHRWGVGRPVGGTQAVPDSMLASLVASGGRVRTNARVEALLTSGDRVTGVRLAGGEELTARRGVVSTIDPAQLLGELLPADALNERQRARVAAIPTAAFGACPAKVDVALSGRLRVERHERRRGDGLDLRIPSGLIGGLDAICRSFPQSAAGRIPDDIHLFTVVPTAMDPSQAPDGQDTLYLYAPAMPRDPVVPWSEQAEALGKSMVSVAAEYYDGIEELEIGRFVETPEDMARRTGAGYAAPPFHVDFAISRIGPLRPALGMSGSRGPVPGLFLGGAGSHPGPGINGVPGRLAARAVIRDGRRGR
jgi:phytoene dehydrogenase-like protein